MKNWNKELIKAAEDGKIEDVKLSLQNGADIEYKTAKGTTACMRASWYGHLQVIKHLLDQGSYIDTQNKNGFSALLLAAANGKREAVQLLIERKCNKEVTNNTGYSALHYSVWLGNLPMTKWLIERAGMDASIKTSWGATPFDLARHHGYCAVMEYLKTVVTELVEDVNPTTSGQMHSVPNVEDNKISIGIKLMSDKKFVPLYLKLLESGSEKKRDIGLVIVGKKGTGKTSLLKRLLGEDMHNRRVSSTNAIEIHKIRCKANDGEWYKLDGNNEETERHARLLKPYEETLICQSKRHMDASVEATTTKVDHPVGIKHQPSQLLLEQAFREIESMLQSKIDLHDKEEYATLFLWDFAGDEEYYHTHQTFLSPDAIYLVVANLNEADDKKAQDLFRFWIDSIHCCSRMAEMKIEYEDNTRKRDPPVVIVGTWKDAVTSETEEANLVIR